MPPVCPSAVRRGEREQAFALCYAVVESVRCGSSAGVAGKRGSAPRKLRRQSVVSGCERDAGGNKKIPKVGYTKDAGLLPASFFSSSGGD